jgi:hypothetical protein
MGDPERSMQMQSGGALRGRDPLTGGQRSDPKEWVIKVVLPAGRRGDLGRDFSEGKLNGGGRILLYDRGALFLGGHPGGEFQDADVAEVNFGAL